MATRYALNTSLQKPSVADRHWDVPINANVDYLDSLTTIGNFAVSPLERPSTSLLCRVASGSFLRHDGIPQLFAGLSSLALPSNSTLALWLDGTGQILFGVAFPASPHLRLAWVSTNATTILNIVDARIPFQLSGANQKFVAKSGDSMSGAFQVVSPTSGVPFLQVDPLAGVLGFFGVNPASQAPKANTLSDQTGGTASDILPPVTGNSPPSTINDGFATLASKINAVIATLKRSGLMAS